MTRVAIMGSGSWGTAFGMVLADAGSDVVVWGRDAEVVEDIATRHRNEAYHPGAGRYTGDDGTDNVRVVVRITPDKVVFRG